MEKPIIFSGPLVRRILAGEKTQTRRVVKFAEFGRSNAPGYDWHFRDRRGQWNDITHEQLLERCPYGEPGDVLWVRECFAKPGEVGDYWEYRADNPDPLAGKWRPSIHMPRVACRLFLRVTNVRVERLQDISEEDAIAEGISAVPFRPDDGFPVCTGYMVGMDDGVTPMHTSARGCFEALWDSINGKREGASWDANPWVWVVEFERIEGVH